MIITNSNHPSQMMRDFFGITEHRDMELCSFMADAIEQSQDLILCLSVVSKELKTDSELAYVSFRFGQAYELDKFFNSVPSEGDC